MIKGVLFDMDGVLFDSERPAVEADRAAAAAMGVALPLELTIAFTGNSEQGIRQLLGAQFGPQFDVDRFMALADQGVQSYFAECDGPLLMPGVRDTLEWLKQKGYRMCVASSNFIGVVEQNLARAGISHYFEAAVGGDQVRQGKPHPEIFMAAARAIDLEPAQCVAVEDSYNGVESAHAAGCMVVMIPDLLPPTNRTQSLAAAQLQRLGQLPGFMEGLEKAGRAAGV